LCSRTRNLGSLRLPEEISARPLETFGSQWRDYGVGAVAVTKRVPAHPLEPTRSTFSKGEMYSIVGA